MKILILGHDLSLSTAVKDMLLDLSHEVDCTNDAQKAIDLTTKQRYNFVLVDYKMPDNKGIWFMRNVNLSHTTKVLLVTGFVDRSVINEMFTLGASGYLIKPFGKDDLVRHLEFFS